MGKKIVVSSFKGGVGKTRISLNLALSLGKNWGVVTNDVYSSLQEILPPERFLKIKPHQDFPRPIDENVIFDLGGYADQRSIKVLKFADKILIPVTVNMDDDDEITTGLSSIKEIQKFNSNIGIIANKIEKPKQLERVKSIIKEFFDYPVFELKYSKSFDRIFSEKQSIRDICENYPLWRKPFGVVADQFDQIVNFIGE